MGWIETRLRTLASGVAHACDGGARLSAQDARRLHDDLIALAEEAAKIEAALSRRVAEEEARSRLGGGR